MVDMGTLTNLLTTFFLLMFSGYILERLGILPASARGTLTDLVIDFVLPCNIIASFLIEFNKDILWAGIKIFVVSICVQAATFVAAGKFYPGHSEKERLVLRYATIFSNAGFLGNAIAQGLYGSIGLLYSSIYLIPVRMVMWSEGVACFSGKRNKNFREILWMGLTHPCIASVIIGTVLMLLQIPLPKGVENTLRAVGNCNTVLSMLLIGNILSDIPIRDVFSGTSFWYCAVRLLIVPISVFAACKLTGVEPIVTAVATVLVGMPAPASAAILASKYHGDEHLAVKIIFLSTVLSLVSIPILCLIMTYIQ